MDRMDKIKGKVRKYSEKTNEFQIKDSSQRNCSGSWF